MSISLDFTSENNISYDKYILQNVSEKKALAILKNTENNSWIFRFDYITQKYYLTIKKDDEFINHHVYLYNKKTGEVFESINNKINMIKKYSSLDTYLDDIRNIYSFSLSQQIIC
jgi:hypothetical protein